MNALDSCASRASVCPSAVYLTVFEAALQDQLGSGSMAWVKRWNKWLDQWFCGAFLNMYLVYGNGYREVYSTNTIVPRQPKRFSEQATKMICTKWARR